MNLETDSARPAPTAPPPQMPQRPDGHARLIVRVQARQRLSLWAQGALYGAAAAVLLALLGGFLANASPALGRALFIAAPVAFACVLVAFGVFLAVATVGDPARTARLVGKRVPELHHDVLAAVELERTFDEGDFSKDLALAFLRELDARVSSVDARAVVDARNTRRASFALAAMVAASLIAFAAWPKRWLTGAAAAFTFSSRPQPTAAREPITGDVELTYRYPAYTGLKPRTVPGTNGEISAPAGTEVQIRTRSDREVARAELVVNGKSVPLQVSGGRDLSGSFVLDKPGAYHFRFLKRSGKVVAEGPDVPIHVDVDASPQVRIVAPGEELEVDPGQRVTLRYEASDDYGLSSLELVYRESGSPDEKRVPLRHDEGRRSKGSFEWDVTELKLQPGQKVTYFLEVRDNDEVEGRKRGVSRTQVLKLYSAAEHRREAVRKAEQLWERLVTHLADRLEGPDRAKEKDVAQITSAQSTDASGLQLAADMMQTANELAKEKDAPPELLAALVNIGEATERVVMVTSDARRLFLRFRGRTDFDVSKRLTTAAGNEIAEHERNVLYLETLLDRQKLQELKELARQLQRDRRELASLIEQYQKTQDEKIRDSVLREIQSMRARIMELMQRMAELAKGIRDEHLNREALEELMQEKDMGAALDEIERLMREGKTDEALAKLQELSMQMEEMLQSLEEAEEESGEQANPELTKKFQEFIDELQSTTAEQRRLADETKELRDRYKQQMKDRLAQKGAQLKKELLDKADEVLQDYKRLDPDALNARADRPLEEAIAELQNLKSALEVEDYDLAAEAAARAERAAEELAANGEQQKQLDEVFQNPPEVRRQSRELSERLKGDARKVNDINQKLAQLFPQPGSMLSEQDQKRLQKLAQEQKSLERKAQSLERRMEEISQMAPVFGEQAQEQMSQIGERMADAAQRMEGRDVSRGYGEQKAALEQLQQFQRQMQQSKSGKGKRGGLPLPMFAGRRSGWGSHDQEKVEIPDEDQFQAPKEFRKDLLEAMKQGAPDKYRDQVKRYYEELVK